MDIPTRSYGYFAFLYLKNELQTFSNEKLLQPGPIGTDGRAGGINLRKRFFFQTQIT